MSTRGVRPRKRPNARIDRYRRRRRSLGQADMLRMICEGHLDFIGDDEQRGERMG
jgi:hypothetical protein